MKLLASDRGVEEVQVNQKKAIKRDKGVFEVHGADAAVLRSSGDFAVVGINFQKTTSYPCPVCKRENLIRDHCGKSGWEA